MDYHTLIPGGQVDHAKVVQGFSKALLMTFSNDPRIDPHYKTPDYRRTLIRVRAEYAKKYNVPLVLPK